MKDISVEQLAKIVGTPTDKLLLQMEGAGLKQSSASDLVNDDDKKTLLKFLKGQQSKDSKTISLNKTVSLKKKGTLDSSIKTTKIAIKRKKIQSSEKEEEIKGDSKRIDFNEIEKKRIEGEEFKKSEEALKKDDFEVYLNCAISHINQEKFKKSLHYLKKALKLNSENEFIFNSLGESEGLF